MKKSNNFMLIMGIILISIISYMSMFLYEYSHASYQNFNSNILLNKIPTDVLNIFFIPLINTLVIAPLFIFEYQFRKIKGDNFEFQFDGLILTFAYSIVGQILGALIFSHLDPYKPSAFLEINFSGTLGFFLKSLLGLFAIDFIYYWIHRAQHKFNLLWKYHSVHHSIRFLNSHNCYHHISEHIVGFLIGLFLSLFVFNYNGIAPFFAYYFAYVGVYNHARVDWLNFGGARIVLADPKFHLSHHLLNPRFHNTNFGGFTAFFDVVFRTYVEPTNEAFDGPYGVEAKDNPTIKKIFKF